MTGILEKGRKADMPNFLDRNCSISYNLWGLSATKTGE